MTVKEHLDDIADFIRENYSVHGVEIGAQGARSITVRLPEDLPLTALCADLWNNFEAPVDLKPGPVLTVWASERNKEDVKEYASNVKDSRQGSYAALFCLWTCSILAALTIGPYLLDSDVYKWVNTLVNKNITGV